MKFVREILHTCSLVYLVSVACIGDCAIPQMKGNFRMECGQSASVYSWYKDGAPLNSSSYLVEKDDERIVVVTNETQNPFGLYTCKTSDVIKQWYLPVQESRGMYCRCYKGGRRKGHTLVFNNGLPLTIWRVYVSIIYC